MAKKAMKVALAAIAIILIVAVAYVAYVVLSYHRLDDSLPLEVDAAPEAQENVLQAASGQELTMVTANLGFGAYNHDFDFFMDGGTESVAASAQVVTDDIEGSAQAIAQADPDFILFQEVDIDGTRSHHVNELDLLKNAFPDYSSVFAQNYDSAFLAWPPYAPHGANKSGIATFSRCQISDAMRRSLPISDGFGKFLDLDRCYSICRMPAQDGNDLVVFNVHLSAYGADASIMEAQRSMLYEDMQREFEAGNYVIAGGDFNHDMIGVSGEVYENATQQVESWAQPYDFDGVPEGFTVAAKAEYDEGDFDQAATCRDTGRPYDGTNDRWVMDSFIYSSNVQRIECETMDLDFAFSDHNPVTFRFTLAPADGDGA